MVLGTAIHGAALFNVKKPPIREVLFFLGYSGLVQKIPRASKTPNRSKTMQTGMAINIAIRAKTMILRNPSKKLVPIVAPFPIII